MFLKWSRNSSCREKHWSITPEVLNVIFLTHHDLQYLWPSVQMHLGLWGFTLRWSKIGVLSIPLISWPPASSQRTWSSHQSAWGRPCGHINIWTHEHTNTWTQSMDPQLSSLPRLDPMWEWELVEVQFPVSVGSKCAMPSVETMFVCGV